MSKRNKMEAKFGTEWVERPANQKTLCAAFSHIAEAAYSAASAVGRLNRAFDDTKGFAKGGVVSAGGMDLVPYTMPLCGYIIPPRKRRSR